MDSLLEPVVETEMQQFCVEMMKRLGSQRRNEHFCDAVLEIGSGDDQAHLRAYRIVFVTKRGYLETTSYHDNSVNFLVNGLNQSAFNDTFRTCY